MQVVHASEMQWSMQEERHRAGSLAFKTLFKGDEGDPNNFRWVLSRNDGDYSSPFHRHNFDQVRFCVKGSANIAPARDLMEGDVGFFPEGTPYGPQKDQGGGRMTLVFQGGGASGLGYMSSAELRRGTEELEKLGTFAGGRFRFHGQSETESRDSYEAIWEHVHGRKLDYPAMRYADPLLFRSANFPWVPDADNPRVSRRLFGSFTERGTRLEMIRLEGGATVTLGELGALVLAFVVHGAGAGSAGEWSEHSAFRIEAGETATLNADVESELHVIVLPTVNKNALV
jgi:hypothetical protein